ncbi:MAG: hypothetical protein Q8R08_03470 [bacterium]|nr:hypothetical protein [bacterium]
MTKPVYKKGHMLVWVGFIGLFIANGIRIIGNMSVLGTLLFILFFALFIWGNLLVLKSRGRSWLWIFWAFVPPVFGAIFIFMLKDKLPQEAPAPVQQ